MKLLDSFLLFALFGYVYSVLIYQTSPRYKFSENNAEDDTSASVEAESCTEVMADKFHCTGYWKSRKGQYGQNVAAEDINVTKVHSQESLLMINC